MGPADLHHLVIEISQVNLIFMFERVAHSEIQDNGIWDIVAELPEPELVYTFVANS